MFGLPKLYAGLAGVALLGLLIAFVGWRAHHAGYESGKQHVQAQWDANKVQIQEVADKALADKRAAEDAAKANNVEVIDDYNKKLVAIAADRDSLAARVRNYEVTARRGAMSQATGERLADVAADITRRQAEIDAAYDAYDKSCRADAATLKALQDEIRPQL